MEKRLERSCHDKILRLVARLLAPLGFRHAKSTFFIRRQQWVIEFIHLHKYRFGPLFRVHLGIRVLNDVFPAPALNGPDSHAYCCTESPNDSQYRLDFGPDQGSIERCSAEIHRWCTDVGSPWFFQFHDPHALLTEAASPLSESGKARLRLALAGESDTNAVRMSESLFGTMDD
jgi:hypothetical protein